ncbi:hypothetical protein ABEP16_21525 [Priestia aryabhattai]|uniref:hypothetical protein n=1 Tax=Priestia aryabhattai TaxID=412384 RepID=UPI003D27EF09
MEEVLQAFYYKRINDSGYTSKVIEQACKIDGYTVKKLIDKGVLTLYCFEKGSSRMPKVYIDKVQVKEFLKKYKWRNNEEIRQHLAQVEEKFLPIL